MLRIFGRVVLMAMVGVLVMAAASWAVLDVTVNVLQAGPTEWIYEVTNEWTSDEPCGSWQLGPPLCDNITGTDQELGWTGTILAGPSRVEWTADNFGDELMPGNTMVVVVSSLCPSAPTNWYANGLAAQGTVFDSPLPVELSSFTAAAGDATITLRWTTASELNNLGFHVYRGLQKKGPYERITAERIEGAGTSTMPRTYTFSDVRLKNGLVYYYKLEDVSLAGVKEMHGPIAAKPAPPVVRSSWGAIKMLLK